MPDTDSRSSIFIRIQFSSLDAAYYQFHVFPEVDSAFDITLARLRNGDSQYVQVFYVDPLQLDTFLSSLKSNPHVEDIHPSSEEEFRSKRSEPV